MTNECDKQLNEWWQLTMIEWVSDPECMNKKTHVTGEGPFLILLLGMWM